MGQNWFIILIYVIPGQPGESLETKFAIGPARDAMTIVHSP